MAEIRCPMCGKPNPDHLDVCQFCEARLKPLLAPDSGDQDSLFPDQPEDELPDWFDFDGGMDDSPYGGSESEDWLTRLGGDPESPPEIEQSRVSARMDFDSDGVPDWLEDLEEDRTTPPLDASTQSVPAEEAEADTFDDDEGGLPDWLSDMGAEETPEQASVPAFTEDIDDLSDLLTAEEDESASLDAFGDDAGDLPAWLSDMGAEADESFAEEAMPAEAGELPSWLGSDEAPSADAVSADTQPVDEGDLPAWLTGDEEETVSVDATPIDEGELPAWLTDMEAAEEAPAPEGAAEEAVPAEEGELPAWLSDMEAAEEAPAPEGAPAFAEEVADLPDWLAGEAAEGAVEEAVPSDEGELPAWLSDMEAAEEAPAVEGAIEEAVPADEGELPAWLTDMEPAEEAPAQEGAPAFAEEAADLPEWLAGEADEGAVEEAVPTEEGELPSWLTDMDGVDLTPPEETSAGVLDSEGDLSDWLSEPDDTSAVEVDAEPAAVADGESRAVPDWLIEMEGASVADEDIVAEDVDAPFISDDEFDDDSLFDLDQLPEWISGEETADVGTLDEAEGELSPAELPGWLAAMRPVESSAAEGQIEQPSGPAESSGPLAGLYSVLTAEPDIARIKAPPVYSSKLQISQAQQGNAGLLQELVETEGHAQPLPLPPLISSRRVFRAILGLIVIVIAFAIVVMDSQMTVMPALGDVPSGVIRTGELVTALSADDTVLIAFDYEPGLTGEMDAAAAAVVDSMMVRGSKLAFVSTSPTGPALAERFVRVVQEKHAYTSGTQYVNLGYIPGGVSGLFAFAQNPRWITPNELNGKPAWDTDPLKEVTAISDFALVVMIVDNPNTARTWIEQVQPQLQATPLIAIVSAQVEPMVQPYYENQPAQIDGLVSGLLGGAAYEALSQENLARNYWDAFNVMLAVAIGAILIGGAFNVISDLLTQRKESGGESA